jgi:hypothetical protein
MPRKSSTPTRGRFIERQLRESEFPAPTAYLSANDSLVDESRRTLGLPLLISEL